MQFPILGLVLALVPILIFGAFGVVFVNFTFVIGPGVVALPIFVRTSPLSVVWHIFVVHSTQEAAGWPKRFAGRILKSTYPSWAMNQGVRP